MHQYPLRFLPDKALWPDGNPNHPISILFSSSLTGEDYSRNYARSAFETDLPDLEFPTCSIVKAVDPGCTLIPVTDDGTPADFYPYYSARERGEQCLWQIGGAIPDSNLFGKNAQIWDVAGAGASDQWWAWTNPCCLSRLQQDD